MEMNQGKWNFCVRVRECVCLHATQSMDGKNENFAQNFHAIRIRTALHSRSNTPEWSIGRVTLCSDLWNDKWNFLSAPTQWGPLRTTKIENENG